MPEMRLEGVSRVYDGAHKVLALDSVNLSISEGDYVAIEGDSGSGKSTLLGIFGLLDEPTKGSYLLSEIRANDLKESTRARYRSLNFSYVFQAFHLLERRPAIDSVELPLFYRGVPKQERSRLARQALDKVGMTRFAAVQSRLLSGGQRQRIAVARALASQATIVLADEPTGNLDQANSAAVIDALEAVHAEGITVVVVTHSQQVSSRANRRIRMEDGRAVEDVRQQTSIAPAKPITDIGRPSTVRTGALVVDAWRNVFARIGRLWGSVLTVGVPVALMVVTLGLGATAAQQVTDLFDAAASREVTVAAQPPEDSTEAPQIPLSALDRVRELRGVDAATLAIQAEGEFVSSSRTRSAIQATWVQVKGDPLSTGRLTVSPSSPYKEGELEPAQALVGETLANRLSIADVAAAPSIFVGGSSFTVVGVIRDSPRSPGWLSAVITARSQETLPSYETISWQESLLVTTSLGAARKVGGEISLAIDAADPDRFAILMPPAPSTLRAGVEDSVQSSMWILAVTVLGCSALSAVLGSLSAAAERRVEFGLRRAVGARAHHILSMLMTETMITGILGAAGGAVFGMLGILVVTIVNRWSPVLDLRAVWFAMGIGIVVALCGAIGGAVRAVRAHPNDVLRSQV